MLNNIKNVLVFCFIISLSACATMTIEGDGEKSPTAKTGTHTVHGTYYSHVWSQPKTKKCETGRGLIRVRYSTNALYSLVSLISLGLYVPQTVEWWCDGSRDPNDDGELYRPER